MCTNLSLHHVMRGRGDSRPSPFSCLAIHSRIQILNSAIRGITRVMAEEPKFA
jgi:hypothetical protein